jgi:hypothetical protein
MKLNKTIFSVLKLLIVVISLAYIVLKIRLEIVNNASSIIGELSNLSILNLVYFVLAVVFVPLNWLLESLKFKILLSNIQVITIWKSFKSIISGVTVSIFMPKRIGDFGGRILFLQKGNRIQGILVTILGNIAQLTITMIVGVLLLPAYLNRENFIREYGVNTSLLFVLSIIAIIVILYIYFNTSKLSVFSKKISFVKKHSDFFTFTNKYTKTELNTILAISLLRYIVFSFQFILLLKTFNVNLSYDEYIIGVSQIYFLMIAIPTFSLGELSIRGSLAILILGSFTPLLSGVLISSIVLWFINLAIPAMIGSLFISQVKYS